MGKDNVSTWNIHLTSGDTLLIDKDVLTKILEVVNG